MVWYVLLFKYNKEWHIDCVRRPVAYLQACEKDRIWLTEAARYAVEHLNLKKDGCHVIQDATLFPLILSPNGYITLSKIPVDALETVRLATE